MLTSLARPGLASKLALPAAANLQAPLLNFHQHAFPTVDQHTLPTFDQHTLRSIKIPGGAGDKEPASHPPHPGPGPDPIDNPAGHPQGPGPEPVDSPAGHPPTPGSDPVENPARHPPGHDHDPVDDRGVGSGAGDPDPKPASDYTENQRWVGRRVQPWDASFTVLPWGLVPQDIVKSEVVPRARDRYESNAKSSILSPSNVLQLYETSIDEVELGAEAAYHFLANTFSKGRPCFEKEHRAQVKPQLAACFDLQLRLIPENESLVEVHDVHDVTVTTAFPLLNVDPTNPEILDKSRWLFKTLGLNGFTAQLHFAREIFGRIRRQFVSGEAQGFCLAVEVIIRTSETAHFGPGKGQRRTDAEHVLWFYSSDAEDILDPSQPLSFELANMNEALSMIQDTATPELWAAASSA
ncbi:Hypothetical Protein FCC1311_097192 [Hondaea fermentalgiana]|uniref:Uncharacterized protein n=1 Tax=Hondaea fermentalgiana TaxID=2315210 RepID=A0A2R5GRI2_9STRA|nr:Hypothetical Protein FCC1311_097192 [Hondaea fermentalgiana]|eukprot:GBG33496.1 Hypothetical Protein FCC1311_097192 [Hondaea fermentalgiana]